MPTRNCKAVNTRVENMWALPAEFGKEQDPSDVFLSIIANRYALVKGTQLIRDELMLSFNDPSYQHEENWATLGEEATECGADLSLPSVLTTCGYTMCGDRICQSNSLRRYQSMVAGRFGSITEGGEMKPELFFATGGGTDSGPTLAHVTVGHAVDAAIKYKLYNTNQDSSFLVNIDVCTHCGHLDIGENNSAEFAGKTYDGVGVIYGLAQESVFRDPRPACGAIVGMLTNFNLQNPVHVRLRNDLGEANYQFLSKNDVPADDGSPCRFLIAAAIIAIQGMRNTLEALGPGGELDERGVGHMTAQVQINNRENCETNLYCARATVSNGVITEQGLGTDATKYTAKMVTVRGVRRVFFEYDGTTEYPIQKRLYMMTTNSQNIAKAARAKIADAENSASLNTLARRPSNASQASEDCCSVKAPTRRKKKVLPPMAEDRDDSSAYSEVQSGRNSLQRSLPKEADGPRQRSSRGSIRSNGGKSGGKKRSPSPMSTPPATPLNEEAAPSDKGNTAIVHEAAYKEGQVAKKQGGMGFWWALVMISAVYMAMLGASVLYVTNVSKTPSQVEMM